MALPVVKWAGGKRQLLPAIIEKLPVYTGTYYEPFFGGGALFLHLQPEKAVINDCNSQLINMYRHIRDDADGIMQYLSVLQDEYNALLDDASKTAYYFKRRELFNEALRYGLFDLQSAALFMFLNKACFNGLYRVNKRGVFNTPPGHRKKLCLYDADNMYEVSALLKNADMKCGDFEDACVGAAKGDFVFFDSPYHNTFDTYQAGGFTEDQHRRLAMLYRSLTDKGVCCMLTNSDTAFIRSLYADFRIDTVDVKRMINRNGSERTGTEIIVTNY